MAANAVLLLLLSMVKEQSSIRELVTEKSALCKISPIPNVNLRQVKPNSSTTKIFV
jgi:hypothetical protein